MNAKLINTMGLAIVNEILGSLHDFGIGPLGGHYEKLCLLAPHDLQLKLKKTIHIQLLCNYPFGITTVVQLSF
jgi:hypothetical protein